jgi:hypothetical protein
MDRALYSIEETRARLGGISRNSLYAMLRAGSLPSVVIGCRRFVSAEAIAALIRNSTTSASPSRDAVRSRRPLAMRARPPFLRLPESALVLVGTTASKEWDRRHELVEATSLLFKTRRVVGWVLELRRVGIGVTAAAAAAAAAVG